MMGYQRKTCVLPRKGSAEMTERRSERGTSEWREKGTDLDILDV
jgi:hypothetical protein